MIELKILLLSGLLHVALLFAHGTYIAAAFGIVWGTGRRDSGVNMPDFGRRFDRTITNNMESMAAFVPVFGAGILAGVTNDIIVGAGLAYLASRVAFAAIYLANIPYVRTLVWFIGQICILVIFATVMLNLK